MKPQSEYYYQSMLSVNEPTFSYLLIVTIKRQNIGVGFQLSSFYLKYLTYFTSKKENRYFIG